MKLAFFETSISLYALLGLCLDDIKPSACPNDDDENDRYPRGRDMQFITGALDNIEQLPPGLRQCLLQRLSLSYSIMHSPTISLPQEARDCVARPLKLKDWCRLTIKDACPQRAVDQNKSLPSIEGICHLRSSQPKVASNCIDELNAQTPVSDS